MLTLPASVCGSTEVNTPMCNAVSALKYCTNITVTSFKVSDNHSVVLDAESYLAELATNCTGDSEAVQLVVLSRQVVDVLAEKVFQSSTVIARAILQLTEHFNWSRITVISDTSDRYFQHTTETLHKMVNSTSSDFSFLQLDDSDSEIEDTINKIDMLNVKIIVVSLRLSVASKLLCKAQERNLVWPEYAWIVHSVDLSSETCGSFEGVITVDIEEAHLSTNIQSGYAEEAAAGADIPLYGFDYCASSPFSDVSYRQIGKESLFISKNKPTSDQSIVINRSLPFPSDLLPQYSPTPYIALFYVCITGCLTLVTVSLSFYIHFRNEPSVKATTVSLSILIYIGCYLMIFYLYILNSTLLPSLHMQSQELKDSFCTIRALLNGIGYPIALIMSTVLIKLLRVYRIFRLQKKVSKFTSSNLALAMYVLLISSPNALICLLWASTDPYRGVVVSSINGGVFSISVVCVSSSLLRWVLLLLIYIIVLSFFLIIFAILTRKIKYQDFKDSKKISVLSFMLVFTCASSLFYWYLLRTIRANPILVHTVLQIGHYCIILECQGLLFAPKLLPIIRQRIMRKYNRAINVPTSKRGTLSTFL